MVVYEPICADSWPAAFTFSQGVKVGNMVFLSGTTATDEKGKIVGPGDIVAQTRQIFSPRQRGWWSRGWFALMR